MEGKKRKNYSNIATQKQLEKKVLQKKRREKNLTRTQIRKFETFHFPLRRPMMHFPSRNQFRSDRNLTFSIDSGILDYDIAWWYQGLIRSSINFNSETRLSFDGEFRLPDRSSREGNERDIVGFWPFMNFLVKGSVGIWFWFANWMNNRYGEGCWYFHGKWKFEVAIGWQNLTIAVRGGWVFEKVCCFSS